MLYRIAVATALLAAAAPAAALPTVNKADAKVLAQAVPLDFGVAMDACFMKCDLSTRPTCPVAENYLVGCGAACSIVEKEKLLVASGCPLPAAPAVPVVPVVPAAPVPTVAAPVVGGPEHPYTCGTATCGPLNNEPCPPCETVPADEPTSPPDDGTAEIVKTEPDGGIAPCMAGCALGLPPDCAGAKVMASSCAVTCTDYEKEELLIMAKDQPCTFADGSPLITPKPAASPGPVASPAPAFIAEPAPAPAPVADEESTDNDDDDDDDDKKDDDDNDDDDEAKKRRAMRRASKKHQHRKHH